MWSYNVRYPLWGDNGSRPSDGYFYNGGEQITAGEQNYLWYSFYTLDTDIESALTDIDSNADGVVDAADNTEKIKNNDIDSDGDGVVNKATDIEKTYKSSDLDTEYINNGDSKQVAAGSSEFIYIGLLPNNTTFTITEVDFSQTSDTSPNGELRLVTINNGTITTEQIIASSITHSDSGPTYENTSGDEEVIGVVIANTDTIEQQLYGRITARIEN